MSDFLSSREDGNVNLEAALKGGPKGIISEVKSGQVPPIPRELLKNPSVKITNSVLEDEDEFGFSEENNDETYADDANGRTESKEEDKEKEKSPEEKQKELVKEVQSEIVLPPPDKLEVIKKTHGAKSPLKVFPIPDFKGDGKMVGFILRRISFGTWKSLTEAATKIAQSKENASADEIFIIKVVVKAVVWPPIKEENIQSYPAGLIETLYDAIRTHSLFYDASRLGQLAYTL